MSAATEQFTPRERELGAIINAYNQVTDQLKRSHEHLAAEVSRLREELKRKNEQLRRRERLAALGEMAAGVAHEIRNPLGGIQLFASMLQQDLADRPDALRMVDKIIKGVYTLETIVADILIFGRPSHPDPSRIELKKLIYETVELASARMKESRVLIEVSSEFDEIEMVTDGTLLQRALLNLLINAIEATDSAGRSDSGTVTVTLARNINNTISITINDEGRGVAGEIRDRIFNPFFTTKDDGTGLGLAIVHQIAEALDGSVQAMNRDEKGAAFTITLPERLEVNDEDFLVKRSREDGANSQVEEVV